MGLDMYLLAKRYISPYDPADAELTKLAKAINFGDGTMGMDIREVTFEAMYWRKANAIHRWFVDNIQDGVDNCAEYYVTQELLNDLRNLCQKVLKNPENAMQLFPPKSGFFFGSAVTDEFFIDDLTNTVERIDYLLDLPEVLNHKISFYYHSSW
jgi:hypothetical protein